MANICFPKSPRDMHNVREEDGQVSCPRFCEDFEMTASDVHVPRIKHQEVAQRGKSVVPMCKRNSQTLRSSSTLDAAQCPPRETQSKLKKKGRSHHFRRRNGTYFWSIRRDFICGHEVHRIKLYIPDETTFSRSVEIRRCH